MEKFDLWSGAEFSDIKFLSYIILWIMFIIISSFVPSFFKSIGYSISNTNTHKDISIYISRFIPYRIFRLIVHITITWGFATLLFSSNINFLNIPDGYPLWGGYLKPTLTLVSVFGILLACFALQKMVRYLWNYIFCWDLVFSKILQYNLFWDYIFCVIVGTSVIVINIFGGLEYVYTIASIVIYLLWRISITMTYIIRGKPHINDCFYLFLYLCTCEVLPYTYVYIILDYCMEK